MNCRLRLRVLEADGALERILRVVRFRGGKVASLSAASAGDARFEVRLELVSERPLTNIMAQLRKLIEVESVVQLSEDRVYSLVAEHALSPA